MNNPAFKGFVDHAVNFRKAFLGFVFILEALKFLDNPLHLRAESAIALALLTGGSHPFLTRLMLRQFLSFLQSDIFKPRNIYNIR